MKPLVKTKAKPILEEKEETEQYQSVISLVEQSRADICEFLLVDKKNPKIFYCKLAKKEIDLAFKPCLLPTEDRIALCPYYRDHWLKANMKKT
ncbi:MULTISPECIES: hypothetical protein [Thermoprotei]|uniref:hypothetical protein n=1 Tax=Thermoprotei TaxID=183924 RepID=UPI003163D174